MTIACATFFFAAEPEVLAARYDELAEPADAYLTQVGDAWVCTDALASGTADWGRQLDLAVGMSEDEVIALSVFLVGDAWALGVAYDGRRGPIAVFTTEDERKMEHLPHELLAIEKALDDLFPDDIDPEGLDALFGAVLEGALPMPDCVDALMTMLGIPEEWTRWSWYETIPEQLFIDPDLADRVMPLGDAKALWEE